MSTPDQPNGPGLTRKQLREIRMTGATPVVTAVPDDDAASSAPDAPAPVEAPAEVVAPVDEAPVVEEAMGAAEPAAAVAPAVPSTVAGGPAGSTALHLPRAAEPAVAAPAPPPDAQVDLGVSPLTRRQARAQERIRTASVPVITPEVAAAHAASAWAPPAVEPSSAQPTEAEGASAEAPSAPPVEAVETAVLHEVPQDEAAAEPEDVAEAETAEAEPEASAQAESVVEAEIVPEPEPEPPTVEPEPEAVVEPEAVAESGAVAESEASAEPEASVSPSDADAEPAEEEKPVLRPEFGSGLFTGPEGDAALAPSFDELIARGTSTTGSVATPHALILSQVPTGMPLTSPVTATGEVLITGSLSLPEGLGSQGHARGAADGKEIDAVLIDGELPAASSPTPIAASAAISTVKGTGEIIRPPAPEKGSKLMLGLGITAGVLAAALIGVLVYALATGVFS